MDPQESGLRKLRDDVRIKKEKKKMKKEEYNKR